jgi:nicotinamide riboside kinase
MTERRMRHETQSRLRKILSCMTTTPRIALIGPSGSGKTTLATALARELGLPLITEQFREARRGAEATHPRDWDAMIQMAQEVGVGNQYFQEKNHSGTGFVSDRSLYDFAVYDAINGYDKAVAQATYDALIYVPPFDAAPPVADGFRTTNEAFIEAERWGFQAIWQLRHKQLIFKRAISRLTHNSLDGRLGECMIIRNVETMIKNHDTWATLVHDIETLTPALRAMGAPWREAERERYAERGVKYLI